ncbi:MAG: nicotinate-nucleotide adenylyltransferase [Bacteroidetes bacterium]|jgi:nicotinate-nucleotide adenylyltransferase|nr:nicotinate-nucleotide adenylyltransferase [Bacteroidota bacterium]MBL0017256.1 nicotinate-nucleotide adenylyltransferase [Bacteroidota bacterium]MBP6640004.1 nicotinate-nucleotide adenylyltransferase [Bacteroidia bacterium]MBP8074295.1 nicotinate-nucleotide adenylyltransferase [Bacteroidia bacterium]
MKVGLFFGSFNPVHVGHLIIAESALNETDLDRVWFVVSPHNPLKNKANLINEHDRLQMVEIALGNNDKIQASNFEFSLPKPSYTIDTLRKLKELHPGYTFSLIMGEDNLDHLHKWKEYEEILHHYPIWVYPRTGSDGSGFDRYPQVRKFSFPYLDISATRVRELLAERKSVRYIVTEKVYDYILKYGLYAAN